METVKEKKSLKDQAKNYAKKQTDKVKNYGKTYKSELQKAYAIGYARGWEDTYDISKKVGANMAAIHGYKKGLANRKKADKYTKQYKGNGRKQQ